ncbi:MAG: transcriptional regulator [Candidatus Cloacimonetes bacterium HGW-Cloacimonetes-1]|jgi:DNA-binding transcriptional ArsR family regulator|nr:MAG: transcriptional regulator [Candidatus Cloacimonetes bacterium HGW-Cloacimonetes-1]
MSDSFFKAIADANRRKILFLLQKQAVLSAGEIATHFEISKAGLSDHLKILKNADLIYSEKKGQYVFYSLNTSVFQDIMNWLTDIIDTKEVQK